VSLTLARIWWCQRSGPRPLASRWAGWIRSPDKLAPGVSVNRDLWDVTGHWSSHARSRSDPTSPLVVSLIKSLSSWAKSMAGAEPGRAAPIQPQPAIGWTMLKAFLINSLHSAALLTFEAADSTSPTRLPRRENTDR